MRAYGFGPDFQIQCIFYGRWHNPDYAVRIAVKKAFMLQTHGRREAIRMKRFSIEIHVSPARPTGTMRDEAILSLLVNFDDLPCGKTESLRNPNNKYRDTIKSVLSQGLHSGFFGVLSRYRRVN